MPVRVSGHPRVAPTRQQAAVPTAEPRGRRGEDSGIWERDWEGLRLLCGHASAGTGGDKGMPGYSLEYPRFQHKK